MATVGEASLLALFKNAYETNCLLEDQTITEEEQAMLEEMTPRDAVENLKGLITELLAFKRESKSTESSELRRQNEQLETMLQKLEAEVRSHIRVEQQLKLLLETAQSRVEELEKEKLQSQESAKERKSVSPVKHFDSRLRHFEDRYREELARLSQKQILPQTSQKGLKSEAEQKQRQSEPGQKDQKRALKDRILHKIASSASLRDSVRSEKRAKTQQVAVQAHFIQKKRETLAAKPADSAERLYFSAAFQTYEGATKSSSRVGTIKTKQRPATAALFTRSQSSLKT